MAERNRKFHGGGPRPDRKDQKRDEALDRQEARNNRSDAEQLEVLRLRGVTKGKEVTRLERRLSDVK